jgi:RNA polymerase sigma-70 factor, ECF subfamily
VDSVEQQAWCERLYEAKAAELLLYGRALGLSHSEAEDVLHDCFLALMRREGAPDDPHHYSVRAYRNRALNYRRGFFRRILREFESQRWFEREETESPGERQAMASLAGLPQEQREVVVLKIWHQYTFQEIGALLCISPNTAAGRYRYALQKLRTALEGKEYEPDEELRDAVTLLETTPPIGEG